MIRFTIQEPKKFFIIYKRDSAKDFAVHVHDGLHRRGVDVFLDIIDIKPGLSQKEWKEQRDRAIENSQVFIFIVTHNSTTSQEIRHELKQANDLGGDIKVFIHNYIWNVESETKISLGKKEVNLKDFQVDQFQNQEELLRKVAFNTLITKIIRSEDK